MDGLASSKLATWKLIVIIVCSVVGGLLLVSLAALFLRWRAGRAVLPLTPEQEAQQKAARKASKEQRRTARAAAAIARMSESDKGGTQGLGAKGDSRTHQPDMMGKAGATMVVPFHQTSEVMAMPRASVPGQAWGVQPQTAQAFQHPFVMQQPMQMVMPGMQPMPMVQQPMGVTMQQPMLMPQSMMQQQPGMMMQQPMGMQPMMPMMQQPAFVHQPMPQALGQKLSKPGTIQ